MYKVEYKTEEINKTGLISVLCPFVNFLNQTDKTQIVKVGDVPFVLNAGDSMTFPKSGISPLLEVKQTFDVTVYNAPSNGWQGKFILTRGYIS
jgi:hypothetical protein